MNIVQTEITTILEKADIYFRIKPHAQAVYTSENAARERGVRLAQIVKTMLMTDGRDRILIAVLPGNRRLDSKKLKRLSGIKNLRFMDSESLVQRFNIVPGAIAPISNSFNGLPVFVDNHVLEEEWVDISSGDPSAGVELASKDLLKMLSNAQVVSISKGE